MDWKMIISIILLVLIVIDLILTIKNKKKLEANEKSKQQYKKGPSPLAGYVKNKLENEPEKVGTVDIDIRREIEKMSVEDERFKDIIDTQIAIQEALNAVNSKEDSSKQLSLHDIIHIDKAERFLTAVIKARKDYQDS